MAQLLELERSRNDKVARAAAWRQFRAEALQREFAAAKKVADDEFKEEKRAHRDRMVHSIMERKKAISEEKNTMSLAGDAPAASRTKRQLR